MADQEAQRSIAYVASVPASMPNGLKHRYQGWSKQRTGLSIAARPAYPESCQGRPMPVGAGRKSFLRIKQCKHISVNRTLALTRGLVKLVGDS